MPRTAGWPLSSPDARWRKSIWRWFMAAWSGRAAASNARLRAIRVHRTRMTTRLAEGRAAWSEYRVLRRFAGFTLLEVRIGTGRTHQIRVHLASIGHPVAGDTLYGAPARVEGMPPSAAIFLHAHRIRFHHPSTGGELTVEVPLPAALAEWMAALEQL